MRGVAARDLPCSAHGTWSSSIVIVIEITIRAIETGCGTRCHTTETTCMAYCTGPYRWHAMRRKQPNWACNARGRGVRIVIVLPPIAQRALHTSYRGIGPRAARITACSVRVAGLSGGTVFTRGPIDGLTAGFTSIAHAALKPPVEFTSSHPGRGDVVSGHTGEVTQLAVLPRADHRRVINDEPRGAVRCEAEVDGSHRCVTVSAQHENAIVSMIRYHGCPSRSVWPNLTGQSNYISIGIHASCSTHPLPIHCRQSTAS